MKNVYITNSGPYIPGNDEIAQAIDSLSARAKQKRVTPTLSLDEMKKCAEQGNAEYQIKLGMIYYEGKDIRQNIVASSKVFQKAANQGDIQGQGTLGYFYEKGLGGFRRNRAAAKELYGKVCDKGNRTGCSEKRRLNERSY